MKQTEPNVHKVLKAMRELEKHPAVKAYLDLCDSFKPMEVTDDSRSNQSFIRS